MNNLSFQEIQNYIEELERSSYKIVIDGINVYIIDMKYVNGKLDLSYICFDQRSKTPEFDLKIRTTVQSLINKEIQQGQKWYNILSSKIYALIKIIRKLFGLS